MRIGIITYDFFPIVGGQGRQVFELYKNLYKNGNFVVFSPCNNNLKNHKKILEFTKLIGKNLLFSLLLNIIINKIIEKNKIDKLHFHCGPGGLILIKKSKCKFICTVHHTYYQQQKYIKSQKWKYVLYLLEKKMYQNADKIIAVSEDTKNILIKNYGIEKNKINVIEPGIDIKLFKNLKSLKIKNSILFVGRLDKRKGINFLIKTMPLIKKEIPEIKLFVIGKGPLKNKLEKYVKNKKLEDNIKFLGFVKDSELPIWYNKCQLTVSPSIFEGFGLSTLESLACGTPVIGTNTDGIRCIIKNKKWLINYGDTLDLSNKIIKFMNNKKTYKINNLKYYTWNSRAKETLKVYE